MIKFRKLAFLVPAILIVALVASLLLSPKAQANNIKVIGPVPVSDADVYVDAAMKTTQFEQLKKLRKDSYAMVGLQAIDKGAAFDRDAVSVNFVYPAASKDSLTMLTIVLSATDKQVLGAGLGTVSGQDAQLTFVNDDGKLDVRHYTNTEAIGGEDYGSCLTTCHARADAAYQQNLARCRAGECSVDPHGIACNACLIAARVQWAIDYAACTIYCGWCSFWGYC